MSHKIIKLKSSSGDIMETSIKCALMSHTVISKITKDKAINFLTNSFDVD